MYPRFAAVPSLAALVLVCSVLRSPAQARVGGLPVTGCSTCHTGGRIPAVRVSIEPPLVMPGQEAKLIVKVPGSTGPGGIYLHAFMKGTFKELPGQGLRLATFTDVVHSAPRPAAGGEVTFEVGWTAPTARGTVNIDAHVVASNGDRAIGGDGYAMGRLSLTIGCEGTEYFSDADSDGFGSDGSPKTRLCEMHARVCGQGRRLQRLSRLRVPRRARTLQRCRR